MRPSLVPRPIVTSLNIAYRSVNRNSKTRAPVAESH